MNANVQMFCLSRNLTDFINFTSWTKLRLSIRVRLCLALVVTFIYLLDRLVKSPKLSRKVGVCKLFSHFRVDSPIFWIPLYNVFLQRNYMVSASFYNDFYASYPRRIMLTINTKKKTTNLLRLMVFLCNFSGSAHLIWFWHDFCILWAKIAPKSMDSNIYTTDLHP